MYGLFYMCCHVVIVIDTFLFLNGTATTEIYTYGHTLSLHDALPISWPTLGSAQCWAPTSSSSRSCWPPPILPHGRRSLAASIAITNGICASTSCRSEEHTSELQSLMRISYAVFCLKKKNIQQYTTATPTCTHKYIAHTLYCNL